MDTFVLEQRETKACEKMEKERFYQGHLNFVAFVCQLSNNMTFPYLLLLCQYI